MHMQASKQEPLPSNALRHNRRQANLNGRTTLSIFRRDAERAGSALEGRLDLIPAKIKTLAHVFRNPSRLTP
jgi:hypothetical protein